MSLLPFKITGFRNKGGLLILYWNFSGFLLFIYCFQIAYIDLVMSFVGSLVLYPMAGLLADVYYGRYKVVRISMWITFFAVVAYNLVLVFKVLYPAAHILKPVAAVIGGVGLLSFSGFQANALQFGMDQFLDASSMEIISYINWYVWVFLLSGIVVRISQIKDCYGYKYEEATFFVLAIFWMFTIISDIFLNHWLVKEPVVHNPLKLIVQVCKYAVKNKYPQLRSSFYFWDRKPHSRLDLGKAKFGGPFTSDQVEDVKTFFRILLLVFVASCITALGFISATSFKPLIVHYKNAHYKDETLTCYRRLVEEEIPNLMIVASIPIFELLLYPLIRKCAWCPKVSILQRFLFGLFLLTLYELYIVTVEAVSSFSRNNFNGTCFLYYGLKNYEVNMWVHVPIDYHWLIGSILFSGSAKYFIITSAISFVYAQAPYSMKGLLSGIVYCLGGIVSGIVIVSWDKIQDKYVRKPTIKITYLSKYCGVFFYGILFTITFSLLIIGLGLVKRYKRRERDEKLPYQQISDVYFY